MYIYRKYACVSCVELNLMKICSIPEKLSAYLFACQFKSVNKKIKINHEIALLQIFPSGEFFQQCEIPSTCRPNESANTFWHFARVKRFPFLGT